MAQAKILISDDDPNILEVLPDAIRSPEYKILTANNGKETIAKTIEEKPQVILLDIKMPDMDGIEILRKIKEIDKNISVIMMAAYSPIDSIVQAMALGAYDYLNKPFDLDKIKILIKRAFKIQALTEELDCSISASEKEWKLGDIVGKDPRMYEVYKTIGKLTNNKATVLIQGETGTGKELVARAIHFNSLFKNKPFVSIDCASLPEDLLESELFGHEKGSFTGAISQKPGKFELASPGGTVFLDEIENISLSTQATLLRVLQEKKIERVGGVKPIQIDIRIIASTNADLEKMVKESRFRKDFYYRLNVIPIHLPPLRKRRSDIPLLVEYFFSKFKSESKGRGIYLPPETMDLLRRYDWPGNVRELKNVIRSATILGKVDSASLDNLSLRIQEQTSSPEREIPLGKISLDQRVINFEKKLIINALEKAGWVRVEAARLLGINYKALKYKMKKYNLERKLQTTSEFVTKK